MISLIHLPNWIGDTVLALPALTGLAQRANAEPVWAGRAGPLALVPTALPGARHALRRSHVPWRFLRAAHGLRRHRASQGLLLTPAHSAALQLWFSGVPQRIGWAEQGRACWLTDAVARLPRGSFHLVEEFAALARRAGAHALPAEPTWPVDAHAAAQVEAWLAAQFGRRGAPEGGYVALCPGARYGAAKQWPLERYIGLAARLARETDAHGVVVGAAAEQAAGEAIVAAAPGRWISACGAGSLRWSAELLRRARVAVSNDSGAMHLAAAVGTPVVALFGPTDPRWTGPRGVGHRVVREPQPCTPCFHRRCPLGEPAPCMAAIDVSTVFAAVVARLGGGVKRAAAFFLDRDGTLIEPVPYLHDPARVRLLPDVVAGLRRLQAAGVLLVLVTNQSGLARGLFARAQLEAVQAELQRQLVAQGVRLARCYHCEHHPDWTGPCACRKPASGMLRQAALELDLDLARSALAGDTVEDLQAGAQVGAQTYLVASGYGAEQAATRRAELPAAARPVPTLAAAVEAWFGS